MFDWSYPGRLPSLGWLRRGLRLADTIGATVAAETYTVLALVAIGVVMLVIWIWGVCTSNLD